MSFMIIFKFLDSRFDERVKGGSYINMVRILIVNHSRAIIALEKIAIRKITKRNWLETRYCPYRIYGINRRIHLNDGECYMDTRRTKRIILQICDFIYTDDNVN